MAPFVPGGDEHVEAAAMMGNRDEARSRRPFVAIVMVIDEVESNGFFRVGASVEEGSARPQRGGRRRFDEEAAARTWASAVNLAQERTNLVRQNDPERALEGSEASLVERRALTVRVVVIRAFPGDVAPIEGRQLGELRANRDETFRHHGHVASPSLSAKGRLRSARLPMAPFGPLRVRTVFSKRATLCSATNRPQRSSAGYALALAV